MNKHYLLAVAITPMLLIAGYMAAGHFFAKSNNQAIYELTADKDCSVGVDSGCVLKSGEVLIDLKIKADRIISESDHDFIRITIGLAKQTLSLQKAESGKYWVVEHDMTKGSVQTLRYVAQAESGYFIAEITP